MKLIIAGSRTFTDYQLLCQMLAPERHRITEVLHGGASPRADRARMAASVRRNHHGAGRRLLVALRWAVHRTAHMVQCMRQFGKPVVVIRMEATA